MTITIESLTRYPIKGLSGQSLCSVQLLTGQGFPGDRQFGFARPNSGFDPNNPKPLPKTRFYMLARDASLALLHCEFNDTTGVLSINSPQSKEHFDIRQDDGKNAASAFIQSHLGLSADETPQLFEASPHRFTDVSVVSAEMMNTVSIINLDSVHHFSTTIGQDIDPNRFRGNIHLQGLPAFSELEKIGSEITIGDAKLKLVQRTRRCPATQVNLKTAERDIDVPKMLQQHYGHRDMGVYAEVLEGGIVATGDDIEIP